MNTGQTSSSFSKMDEFFRDKASSFRVNPETGAFEKVISKSNLAGKAADQATRNGLKKVILLGLFAISMTGGAMWLLNDPVGKPSEDISTQPVVVQPVSEKAVEPKVEAQIPEAEEPKRTELLGTVNPNRKPKKQSIASKPEHVPVAEPTKHEAPKVSQEKEEEKPKILLEQHADGTMKVTMPQEKTAPDTIKVVKYMEVVKHVKRKTVTTKVTTTKVTSQPIEEHPVPDTTNKVSLD